MLPVLKEEVGSEKATKGFLEYHRHFTNSAANLIDKKFKVIVAVICLEDSRYDLVLLSVEIAMLAELVGVFSMVDTCVEL